MTAGCDCGRAFPELGRHPGQCRARGGRARRLGRARGRQRGADAAQRLSDLRSQHGGEPARRLRRADQLAFHAGGGGLHPGRQWRQGAGGAHRPSGADRPRHSRRREGSGRADARGDRRRLQRAGGEAPGAGGRRDLGRLRGAQRAQHPAAQSGTRQHDLHIGHDRAAQGRAPPALVAREAGRLGARMWRATGDFRPISRSSC